MAAVTPGGRLRAARVKAGLTQGQLADRLSVGLSYVSDIERGRRGPSLDWLARAADAIGCDRRDLDGRLAPAGESRRLTLVRGDKGGWLGLSDEDCAESLRLGAPKATIPDSRLAAFLRASVEAGVAVAFPALPPLAD